MRIEVTELMPMEDIKPGDIYSDKPQEWWDLTLTDNRIGVVLYVRSEFELPEAYAGTSTRLVIIHRDQEGVRPSPEVHIADEIPDLEGDHLDNDPAQDEPFHCTSCGGMGTEDNGSPCKSCGGTGVAQGGD